MLCFWRENYNIRALNIPLIQGVLKAKTNISFRYCINKLGFGKAYLWRIRKGQETARNGFASCDLTLKKYITYCRLLQSRALQLLISELAYLVFVYLGIVFLQMGTTWCRKRTGQDVICHYEVRQPKSPDIFVTMKRFQLRPTFQTTSVLHTVPSLNWIYISNWNENS